jgi:hypothetical protein
MGRAAARQSAQAAARAMEGNTEPTRAGLSLPSNGARERRLRRAFRGSEAAQLLQPVASVSSPLTSRPSSSRAAPGTPTVSRKCRTIGILYPRRKAPERRLRVVTSGPEW